MRRCKVEAGLEVPEHRSCLRSGAVRRRDPGRQGKVRRRQSDHRVMDARRTASSRPGFKCPTPNQPCVPTACGDGVAEGTEQCDDGNHDLGDGCTPFCVNEPNCSAGPCTSTCGDGLKLPSDNEQCEDGNTVAGDGCSPTCQIEPGYQCMDVSTAPTKLDLPIVIRDFKNRSPGLRIRDRGRSRDRRQPAQAERQTQIQEHRRHDSDHHQRNQFRPVVQRRPRDELHRSSNADAEPDRGWGFPVQQWQLLPDRWPGLWQRGQRSQLPLHERSPLLVRIQRRREARLHRGRRRLGIREEAAHRRSRRRTRRSQRERDPRRRQGDPARPHHRRSVRESSCSRRSDTRSPRTTS